MRNGIYTAKPRDEMAPHIIIEVHDNIAFPWSVHWYGDLAEWEILPYHISEGQGVDVSGYDDNEYPEMIADMVQVYWDEVYVDHYDAELGDNPSAQDVLNWWIQNFD